MSMKNEILSGLLLVIFAAFSAVFILGIGQNVWAATTINATDTINVLVNISEKCIVDISPADLNWTTPLDPGSEGTYKRVQVENMGSTNLTYIWFNNSYPATNPFGTGNVSAYDAGNFIVVGNDTGIAEYFFPNRLDYNSTNDIIYLRGPTGATPPASPYGRFRNASREYFWAVTVGTSNYTDGTFYISNTAHTLSTTGADLQNDASSVGLTTVTDAPYTGLWGYGAINVGGVMPICVAMYHDGSKAMFYKWNMDAPGADLCANAEYFIDPSTTGAIAPGASALARVVPYVPYGVVYNETNPEITGTVTVLVTSQ